MLFVPFAVLLTVTSLVLFLGIVKERQYPRPGTRSSFIPVLISRLVSLHLLQNENFSADLSTQELEDLSHGIRLNEARFLCYLRPSPKPSPLSANLERADACASCRKSRRWAGSGDCEGGQARRKLDHSGPSNPGLREEGVSR